MTGKDYTGTDAASRLDAHAIADVPTLVMAARDNDAEIYSMVLLFPICRSPLSFCSPSLSLTGFFTLFTIL